MIRERITKIQNELSADAAFLVSSDKNRFYYTGFESSAGAVLITKTEAYFLIDFRYFEKAKSTVTDCTVMLSSRTDEEIRELCEKNGVKTIFIETYSTSVSRLSALKSALS